MDLKPYHERVDSIHKTEVMVFGEVKVGKTRDVQVNFGDGWSLFSVIQSWQSNTHHQASRDDFATTNWSSPGVSSDTSELNVNELAELADVSSIG